MKVQLENCKKIISYFNLYIRILMVVRALWTSTIMKTERYILELKIDIPQNSLKKKRTTY